MVAKKIYKSPIIIHPDIPSISFSFSFINSMAFSSARSLGLRRRCLRLLAGVLQQLGPGRRLAGLHLPDQKEEITRETHSLLWNIDEHAPFIDALPIKSIKSS